MAGKVYLGMLAAVMGFVLAISLPANAAVEASNLAPAPHPSSDGTSVDQGIAYVLMFLALVLTYIIH